MTILPTRVKLLVIPSESPVVPNADATSNTIERSDASSVIDKIKIAPTHKIVDKPTTTIAF